MSAVPRLVAYNRNHVAPLPGPSTSTRPSERSSSRALGWSVADARQSRAHVGDPEAIGCLHQHVGLDPVALGPAVRGGCSLSKKFVGDADLSD